MQSVGANKFVWEQLVEMMSDQEVRQAARRITQTVRLRIRCRSRSVPTNYRLGRQVGLEWGVKILTPTLSCKCKSIRKKGGEGFFY